MTRRRSTPTVSVQARRGNTDQQGEATPVDSVTVPAGDALSVHVAFPGPITLIYNGVRAVEYVVVNGVVQVHRDDVDRFIRSVTGAYIAHTEQETHP